MPLDTSEPFREALHESLDRRDGPAIGLATNYVMRRPARLVRHDRSGLADGALHDVAKEESCVDVSRACHIDRDRSLPAPFGRAASCAYSAARSTAAG